MRLNGWLRAFEIRSSSYLFPHSFLDLKFKEPSERASEWSNISHLKNTTPKRAKGKRNKENHEKKREFFLKPKLWENVVANLHWWAPHVRYRRPAPHRLGDPRPWRQRLGSERHLPSGLVFFSFSILTFDPISLMLVFFGSWSLFAYLILFTTYDFDRYQWHAMVQIDWSLSEFRWFEINVDWFGSET